MSPTAKGLIVSAINLFTVGLLIAIFEAREHHWLGDVLFVVFGVQVVGLIPALTSGAALGWLAGRLDVARTPILLAIALAWMTTFGLLTEPRWIYLAAAPTVIWTVRLERSTRRGREHGPVPPIAAGAMVAVAAIAAIAATVGLGLQYGPDHQPGLTAALGIYIFGLVPSLVIGAGLGWLAHRIQFASRRVRRLVLCAPVIAIVALLAATAPPFVSPALAPAVAAMLLLERVTRSRLPVARVLVERPGNQSSGAAI